MSQEHDDPKGGEQGWGEGPNLRYDDFVGRIVQDPNDPPNVTLLSGYLGASSEEGHVRLYLDEELGRYVEIPEKAVLHTQELPPEQSPLGGSLIWIERDAEVVHGAAGTERRKATFLEGQIAQDYIGGPGVVIATDSPTLSPACGVGGDTLNIDCIPNGMTVYSPACGQSQTGPCIPPTEMPWCRTRTGIFCTRFGPTCRRTIFEPNCRTVFIHQCQSIAYPCVTVNQSYCVESGFRGCSPVDFTVWEEQYGGQQQAGFAARRGGLGGFDDPTFTVFQTGSNCPSVFDNCATRESFCPSQSPLCSSQLGPCDTQLRLCVTRSGICDFETRSVQNCIFSVNVRCPPTEVNCPSRDIPCPTRFEPRCFASRVAICPDTRAGCQVQSVACGFDPAGGVLRRGGGAVATPGVVAVQPTRFCPSRLTICPSQYIRCRTRNPVQCFPTWILICNPTQYNCPTMPNSGCPGYTQFGSCETLGGCPSAVDACPSRFGCESQAGCAESIACQSQGCIPGGGGVDPAGGAGGGAAAQGFRADAFAAQEPPPKTSYCVAGGGGAVGAIPQTRFCPSTFDACPTRYNCPSQYTRCPSVLVRCPSQVDACPTQNICPSQYTPCQSQLIRCPSALDACPTRFNCPSLPNGCPEPTVYGQCETFGPCPSAVDACPSRFGCYDTQVCGGGESVACYPGGGGGGFDPGGFGGGGGGGGF